MADQYFTNEISNVAVGDIVEEDDATKVWNGVTYITVESPQDYLDARGMHKVIWAYAKLELLIRRGRT